MGREVQHFTQDVVAADGDDALHIVYSTIGSRHKANRRAINIDSCEKIDPRESKEPRIINHFREQLSTMEPLAKAEEE